MDTFDLRVVEINSPQKPLFMQTPPTMASIRMTMTKTVQNRSTHLLDLLSVSIFSP